MYMYNPTVKLPHNTFISLSLNIGAFCYYDRVFFSPNNHTINILVYYNNILCFIYITSLGRIDNNEIIRFRIYSPFCPVSV